MAAILNSAILDSDTAILDTPCYLLSDSLKKLSLHSDLLSSLRFSHFQNSDSKHSHSILTLTQTAILDSIWLTQKHSHSTQTNLIWLTRWWQPSWILPSWIQPCCTKLWLNLIQSDSNSFILTQLDDGSHLEFWPSWIQQPFCKKLRLKLVQSDSLKLTQLHDDNTCHSDHGSHYFHKKNFTHSFWLNLMMAAILNSAILDSDSHLDKKTSLTAFWLKLDHSDLTWWWQPSWILAILDSAFAHVSFYLSNSLMTCQD